MPYVVTDAILDAVVVKQIVNTSTRSSPVVRHAKYSGGVVTQEIYGVREEQVTTITSYDCGGVAGFNSSTFVSAGLYVSSGTVTVPYKNRANGGTFEGATSHSHITGTDALAIPTSFEATQDSEQGATVNLEVHWISSDGTSSAFTGSSGNSIAAEAYNVEFALGPVDINGTDLSTVQSIRVNPGLQVVKRGGNGAAYPTHCSIQRADPSIDITVDDIDEVIAYTDGFTDCTSFECYFRKRADGGIYVADGTAEHIKFSFANGMLALETIDAPETGNGQTTIRIHGEAMTVSAASAIT